MQPTLPLMCGAAGGTIFAVYRVVCCLYTESIESMGFLTVADAALCEHVTGRNHERELERTNSSGLRVEMDAWKTPRNGCSTRKIPTA